MRKERIPAMAFRPGEYVRDELVERKWTVDHLAHKAGLDRETVNSLIHEDHYPVSHEIAFGLSKAFGTSVVFWKNMERIYTSWLNQDR